MTPAKITQNIKDLNEKLAAENQRLRRKLHSANSAKGGYVTKIRNEKQSAKMQQEWKEFWKGEYFALLKKNHDAHQEVYHAFSKNYFTKKVLILTAWLLKKLQQKA